MTKPNQTYVLFAGISLFLWLTILPSIVNAQGKWTEAQDAVCCSTTPEYIEIKHWFSSLELSFQWLTIEKALADKDVCYHCARSDGRTLQVITLPVAEFNVMSRVFTDSYSQAAEHWKPEPDSIYKPDLLGSIRIILHTNECKEKVRMQPYLNALQYFSLLTANTNDPKYALSNQARISLTEYLLRISTPLENLVNVLSKKRK